MLKSGLKRRKDKNKKVAVLVMQNGVPIAKKNYDTKKNTMIRLTSKGTKGNQVEIPNYHFYEGQQDILEIRGNKAFLKVSFGWEGIGTSRGELINYNSKMIGERSLELEQEDYFTLGYRDLRILIKVEGETQSPGEPKIRKLTGYRGRSSEYMFRDSSELMAIVAGASLALVICGGFVGGLLANKFVRPTTLDEIAENYIIPFVAPRYLISAPELLKENLNIKNITLSVLDLNHSIVDTLLGQQSRLSEKLINRETRLNYSRAFAEIKKIEATNLEIQKSVDSFQRSTARAKIIAVPAIKTESLNGTIHRILDKIDILLLSAEESLALRKDMVRKFQEDEPHTYEAYQNIGGKDERAEALKQIKPWAQVTSEDQMYAMVASLAKRASILDPTKHSDSKATYLEPPIGVVPGSKFVTFDVNLAALDDQKVAQSVVGTDFFVVEAKTPPKAPMPGDLEPEKIENFIKLHKYQLQICYEIALRRDEASEGVMEWRWKVDSKGRIFDIAIVVDHINDDKMANCIREKISQWRFPRPRNGAIEVSFPFEFLPTRG